MPTLNRIIKLRMSMRQLGRTVLIPRKCNLITVLILLWPSVDEIIVHRQMYIVQLDYYLLEIVGKKLANSQRHKSQQEQK